MTAVRTITDEKLAQLYGAKDQLSVSEKLDRIIESCRLCRQRHSALMTKPAS